MSEKTRIQPRTDKTNYIMKKIYTIGRDEGCDIVIPDSTDVISRLHATIRVESNDKIFLIDQSRNGTYVNGMKMSSNVEIPVSRKDVISFAHIYNLDWSLVPKHNGNTLKTALVILSCLIVMTGIAYAVISYLNKQDVVDTPTEVQDSQLPPIQDEVMKPDTVVVRDTVVVAKEKPKVKEVKQDTVKVEKPKDEEVYNPIY